MGDMDEVNPQKPSKKLTKERTESDQRLVEVALEQVPVQEQVIADKSMRGISGQGKDEPSSSMTLRRQLRGSRDRIQEQNKSGCFVQDQIIIAPEIMGLILGHLDLRSLKICRLVCKSWHQEAQAHLERRSVVCFTRNDYTGRIKAFKETKQKKLSRALLPQPCLGLDVDLYVGTTTSPYKLLLNQLDALLRLPVVLTRFSPADVPLKLVLPLIIKSSLSLEYLELYAEPGSNPPMVSQPTSFPQLRHVTITIWDFEESQEDRLNFSSMVALIVNASPKLDKFRSLCKSVELGSEILLKVDITRVTYLTLCCYELNRAAAEHFLSMPFSRLQHLELENVREVTPGGKHAVLLAMIAKCAPTLKKLNLSMIYMNQEFEELLANSGFPVCPNVEDLTLFSFGPYWKSNIFNCFPSLRVLFVKQIPVHSLGDLWGELPPFFGIKALRAACYSDNDELSATIVEKFPELERLRLDVRTLLGCCRLGATGDPRFSNILKSVKHLELEGNHLCDVDASPLGVLRGIETITLLTSNADIPCIPFEDLWSLKVIQFPWGDYQNLEKLLEFTKRVGRIIVTNCCSVPRFGDQQSLGLLNKFFDASPNAECGCGKGWK